MTVGRTVLATRQTTSVIHLCWPTMHIRSKTCRSGMVTLLGYSPGQRIPNRMALFGQDRMTFFGRDRQSTPRQAAWAVTEFVERLDALSVIGHRVKISEVVGMAGVEPQCNVYLT